MTMDALAVAAIVGIKLAGSIAGAGLSLIYTPPKTIAEFVTRGAFSVVSGMIFSDGVMDYMHWADTMNYELAAAALTSMLSWFAMAAVVRVIGMWKGPK